MEVKDFWQRAVSLNFTVWSYGSKLKQKQRKVWKITNEAGRLMVMMDRESCQYVRSM